MHVLGLTDHLGNVGGAEISAHTILVGLANHDGVDRVTVIGMEGPDATRLEFEGVETVTVEPPPAIRKLPDYVADLLIERRLARAARKRAADVDVIHAHHRRSALALRRLDVETPKVATVRDYWPTCPISIYDIGGERCTGCDERLDDCVAHQGWDGIEEPGVKAYLLAKRRHQRPALDAADSVVFISNHIRRQLTGDVPMPDRTEVIYNPVEIDADVEPTDFDVPTFVTASSLSKSKGVETVIRAMGQLTNEYPDAQLIVFGDGPLRGELEGLAASVTPGTVEFRGRVDPAEVYAAMAGAIATVFPSVWDEPFGRVTVESMMLGTPVVGSDVGGIAEIIEDGETGLLFPPQNPNGLTDRLVQLLTNPDLGDRLIANGRDRATAFTPATITESYAELYQSL